MGSDTELTPKQRARAREAFTTTVKQCVAFIVAGLLAGMLIRLVAAGIGFLVSTLS